MHIRFEMPIRHPNGEVKWPLSMDEFGVQDKCVDASAAIIFIRLSEITKKRA